VIAKDISKENIVNVDQKKDEKLTEDQESIQELRTQQYGNSRYIVVWTVVIMLGLALQFFARVLGYEDNPLNFYHPLVPAFTGVSSAVLVLVGYFILMNEKAKKSSMTRRNGVLIVILGLSMLGAFFICKEIIPLIF